MTSRFFAALLAPMLIAAPALAQEGDEAAAPAAEAVETAPAEGEKVSGDADTSEPTGDKKKADAAAIAGGMAGMTGGGDDAFPLHIMGSFTQFLGQGTFVGGAADNPMVSSSLWVSPFAFWNGVRFALSQSFDFEWTQSDTTTTPNQITWSDTALQVSYPGLALPDLGLRFLLSGSATLPISLMSRQQGRVTGLSSGGQVMWSYAPWGINAFAGGSATYNINVPALAQRSAVDDVRPYEDRHLGLVTPSGCVRRNATDLNNYACGDIPALGGYRLRAGGGWSTLEGQLSFNATVSLMQQFSSFLGPDDQYTSDYAQTGLQQGDAFTVGVLQATYVPTSWFFLTVGTQTFQPLYNTKRDGLRPFPFWDFSGPANNWSSVFVDTTFMF